MYRLVFLVKRSCITGRKSETKVVGLFFFFSMLEAVECGRASEGQVCGLIHQTAAWH